MKTRKEVEDYVKNFLYNKETHKFQSGRTGKAYLIRHGWYDSIMNYYDDSSQMIEILYRILNGIDKKPVCKMCGKPVKFSRWQNRFNIYCSRKCENSDPDMKKINAMAVSKALKKTYQERGTEIKVKRQQTLKEHYGSPDNQKENFTSPFSIPKIQKKGKQTLIKHYGVDNIFKDKEWKKKMIAKTRNTLKQKYHQKWLELYNYDVEYHKDYVILKNECPVHGDIKLTYLQFDNGCLKAERRYHGKLACPICNPERNPETSIEFRIKEILNGFNLNFKEHDRSVLRNPNTGFPLELDFYLPDNKLAIECNGNYWHSEYYTKEYDISEKLNQCHEKGIQLLTFWEDDINNPIKLNIIKDIICTKINKNKKVFARKCKIEEISSEQSRHFIDMNHIQGNINASVKLGLFYNEVLVEVMTFGKPRVNMRFSGYGKNTKDIWELYRLCTKCGFTVTGGASKLFNYFFNHYKPEIIFSYCQNDLSSGNIYKKLGFEYVRNCGKNFYYVKKDKNGFLKRINRYTLRKSVVDDGSGRTADEILEEQGYVKIWNNGSSLYQWKKYKNKSE